MLLLVMLMIHKNNCVLAYGPRAALDALWEQCDRGEGWVNASLWNSSASVCDWYGVTCEGTAVIELNLHGNGIGGCEIPEAIGQLGPSLTALSLAYNNFEGSIPPSIANLTGLRTLDMSLNSLSGTIPPALFTLTGLQSISLYSQNLTGSLPSLVGLPALRHINVWDNALTGQLPAVSAAANPNLHEYGMSANGFTGGLPTGLGSLPNLNRLYVDQNKLEGKVEPPYSNPNPNPNS